MSRFAHRSTAMEIMDDLDCSGEVVHQTLRELEFINRTLGGNAVTLSGVNQLLSSHQRVPVHILDLGCGGGDMLSLLKAKLTTKATFKGIDANPNIVRYAMQHNGAPDVQFEAIDVFSENFQNEKCDIAIATLFFHHFTHEQLVILFSRLHQQTNLGFVVNDLHRHPLAYYSIKLLTQLFSKSDMVKYDAPLSVLRGFRRKEIIAILKQAGIEHYELKWKWAFRWQLVVKKSAR